MQLESLNIRGYRSLYEVTLAPGDLTVLTGPNNAGKTNLVEAVDFLAEAYRHGPETAINRKGGIENIAYRRGTSERSPLSFAVTVRFSYDELRELVRFNPSRQHNNRFDIRLHHRFSISAVSDPIEADFEVEDELIEISVLKEEKEIPFLGITKEEITNHPPDGLRRDQLLDLLISPLDEPSFLTYAHRRSSGKGILFIRLLGFSELLRHYTSTIGRTRLYQLVPLECRRPGVPTPNAELDRHGESLPALIAYMKRHDVEAWENMLKAMRRVVPGLKDVKTSFTPDRRLSLQFVEAGVRSPWSSEDVSDGTIQSLALFAALYDRRTSLILVEEPENSVHPWILRVFVDACREASGKQIIITTHSPVLINYLKPEEVWLVWRRRGRTYVRTLTEMDEEAEAIWGDGRSTVFDLLDSGWLPESVPELSK
jgi:predicted ATPase